MKFIFSIWDYDYIEKLNNNQWNCFWCGVTFQGINATKALTPVLGVRSMLVKSFNISVDKLHVSKYKDIKIIKNQKSLF